MSGKSKSAGLSLLLLVGLAALLTGQGLLETQPLFGACTLVLGVLLLLGGAVLAYRQRQGRRPQARLMGEEAGVLASEKGFYPVRQAEDEQRRQVHKRIADKPERAADSVRGFLANTAPPAAPPGKAPGKRRNSDG